jgi:hypothetical protein
VSADDDRFDDVGITPGGLEAMGDAVADMEEEGERFVFGFVASYMVRHPEKPPEHGIVRVRADNHREAGWMAYTEVQEEYPHDQGWMPPSIVVVDQPFLIVPQVPYPVMTDPDNGVEEASDVEGNS